MGFSEFPVTHLTALPKHKRIWPIIHHPSTGINHQPPSTILITSNSPIKNRASTVVIHCRSGVAGCKDSHRRLACDLSRCESHEKMTNPNKDLKGMQPPPGNRALLRDYQPPSSPNKTLSPFWRDEKPLMISKSTWDFFGEFYMFSSTKIVKLWNCESSVRSLYSLQGYFSGMTQHKYMYTVCIYIYICAYACQTAPTPIHQDGHKHLTQLHETSST